MAHPCIYSSTSTSQHHLHSSSARTYPHPACTQLTPPPAHPGAAASLLLSLLTANPSLTTFRRSPEYSTLPTTFYNVVSCSVHTSEALLLTPAPSKIIRSLAPPHRRHRPRHLSPESRAYPCPTQIPSTPTVAARAVRVGSKQST